MRHSCVTLLCFMVLAWTTLPSAEAQNGTALDKPALNFRIQASPDTIIEGETEESEVRCDYFGPFPLFSLGIVHTSDTSDTFETLAHVALNQPKQVVASNGIKAEQTSGEIKADGRSGYLSIKWSSPSQRQGGLYKCKVVTVIGFGEFMKSEKRARVKVNEITIASLLRIVGSLKEEIASMKGEIGSVKGEVGSMKGEIGSVKGEIGSVKGDLGSVKGEVGSVKVEVGRLNVVSFWEKYKNHAYYLKLNLALTQSKAKAFCQRIGGYLAEIDDGNEYHFMVGFVSTFLTQNSLIMIGGSDLPQEGTWTFQRTNASMPFIDWGPGQPNGGQRDNCMCLWNSNRKFVKMGDLSCDLSIYEHSSQVGFLCEVPGPKA